MSPGDQPIEGAVPVPSPARLRAELTDLIVGDLLGPAGGTDEIVTDRRVRDRYLVGMLAPAGTIGLDPARADDAGADPGSDDEVGDEQAAKLALAPSSFGMTFAVDPGATALEVSASWGRYRRVRSEVTDGPPWVWRREPIEGTAIVSLAGGDIDALSLVAAQPGVIVRGRARRLGRAWLVSLFLVNGQRSPESAKDSAWLFQAEMAVRSPDGGAVFCGRPEALADLSTGVDEEPEAAQLDLLYRNVVEFAVGHGIGVHAEVAPGDPTRAVGLVTRSVPSYEVAVTEAPDAGDASLSAPVREKLARVVLDMARLASTDGAAMGAALTPLVEAYEAWLDEQEARLAAGAEGLGAHAEAAALDVSVARGCAARLRHGIEVLGADPVAAEAFRFANEAMWRQRVHTLAAGERRRPGHANLGIDEAVARFAPARFHSWRAFQLAFLLLNLPAVARPDHPERSAAGGQVDLLFFPTGGGKTEAYLGLTAFTLAIRRLQGTLETPDGALDGRAGGVGVLMRYTLRLLTAQQFQRAAALMCACEIIRRERVTGDERWGHVPLRLGMWVGAGVTPNRFTEAHETLQDYRSAGRKRAGRSSPLQLVACPWCGARLDAAQHARSDPDRRRILVFCADPFGACPFTEAGSPGEGIPVVTVDEELYRLLPAFVIATADKFAQLPWQGALHTLFGRVERRCERHGYRSPDLDRVGEWSEADSHPARKSLPAAHTVAVERLRPPDLIIQDELHLISGPLGTMVGLYETAIDSLATWRWSDSVVRPKVVASTATVRRAEAQAHALFARGLAVFPPPVLDVGDSFFAKQRPVTDDTPGRLYVGVCARGTRLKTVEAKVFETVMASAKRLWDRWGMAADPWMTTIAYFNALRELAGAKRLVEDEVATRLRKSDRRGLARRPGLIVEELTSRISSTEIPAILDQLGVVHDPARQRGTPGDPPIDLLLATSMISVGVDVARLAMMVTVGQPKATAEYIQSTSRVGRDPAGPGLVVAVYNWARPRDLSHYETFEHYHATFYRHVEALSVTPFSPRALDRGLTAVLVALARQGGPPAWNPNLGAGHVPTLDARMAAVVDVIAARSALVSAEQGTEALVRDMVAQRLDGWSKQQGVVGVQLGYDARRSDGTLKGLLRAADLGAWELFSAPNSLRETEPNVHLILDRSDGSLADAPGYELGAGSAAPGVETAEDEEAEEADLASAEEVGA